MTQIGDKERDELEMLMPWYVNGTLDADSVERIEAALEHDPALQRSLEVLTQDREAVLELADADDAPASMEARFMAQLDAEPAVGSMRAPAQSSAPDLLSRVGIWVGDIVAAMTPPRLAVVAAAACLLVVAQSGVIISMLGDGSGFETASGPGGEAGGTAVLVQFAPDAELSDIAMFLETQSARIADGPLPGGMFRLEFDAADERSAAELAALLRTEPGLFGLVLPGN